MSADIQTATIAAASALAGATLGFAGSYVIANKNLRKEISLKVAEYRLSWINNLGDQFAIYLSCAIRLGFGEGRDTDKDASSVRQEMMRSATRVELWMNHEDPDYPLLRKNMSLIDQLILQIMLGKIQKDSAIKVMADLDKEFVRLSNSILKREWRRTKQHLRDDTVEVSALKSDSLKLWHRKSY